MKRFLLIALAAAALAGGCQNRVERMISIDTQKGDWALSVAGSPAKLKDRGVISAHRPFTLADGTLIDVWIIQATPEYTIHTGGEPRGTILVLHDLGESKGNTLKLGRKLSSMGYDVVLPDLRAHGRSTGTYVTYGAKEKTDLASVMGRLLQERQIDGDIHVYGEGYGGSIAIGYALTDAENCQGVIALHPYAGPRSILEDSAYYATVDHDEMTEIMEDGARQADFKLTETSAVQAARRLTCPLFILAKKGAFGGEDEDAELLYESANGPKLLEHVAGSNYTLHRTDYIAGKIDALASGQLELVPARELASPPSMRNPYAD